MNDAIGVLPQILQAFVVTVQLALFSSFFSIVLGLILATMHISPIPPLQFLASVYIRLVRNTPLTIVFFMIVFGLPQIGINISFVKFAVLALSLYTATFIAETIRAGIQAIPGGQIEAARSIGMGFGQILRFVVMPQALRSVIAPLASVFIALLKNTSIASAFGVTKAIGTMTNLVNVHSNAVLAIMFTTAIIFVGMALLLGRIFAILERKVAIAR